MSADDSRTNDYSVRTTISADHTPVETVLSAVEAAEDIDPTGLPVLHDVIDPDALNEVIHSAGDGIEVRFVYSGYHVTVTDDSVVIRPAADD